MLHSSSPQQLAQSILGLRPHFKPKLGIILGSGLAYIADAITDQLSLPYNTLPGFPVSRVSGHPGQLILGYFNQVPVACCKGRVHPYEGAQGKDFRLFIRTLKCLGCDTLLMTNAVGSLHQAVRPGQLVLITDHINFNPLNPLIGPNDEEFGPRFFSLMDAYDKNLRSIIKEKAKELCIPLSEGVYICVQGPYFETPAEIRAFRTLGAHVVGMSTIPEVIVARHCGLKVSVISVVTNLAAGLSDEPITHEGTLRSAQEASTHLNRLLKNAIPSIKTTPNNNEPTPMSTSSRSTH